MKANRQKGVRQPHQGRSDKKVRTTLRELAELYPLQEVQLVCNQELSVVEKKIRGRFAEMNVRKWGKPTRVDIEIGEGSTTLGQCLAMFEQGSQDEYVLVVGNEIGQNRCRAFSATSQNTSQTALKTNPGWRAPQQYTSQQFTKQDNPAEIDCFREGKMYVPEDMSIVEEIPSESVQSDYCMEILNINQPTQSNPIVQNEIGDIKAKYLHQALCKEDSPVEKDYKPTIEVNKGEEEGQGERFSFTKRMERGMMYNESIQVQKMSYQLAGHDEIQQAKEQIKPNIPSQSLGMNSILSLEPTPLPQEAEPQPQNNNDNQPSQPLDNPQQSQRMQLSLLAKQHEDHSKGIVQITQKTIQPNRSQFYVRYNFRFLQKKTQQTDVMRISPLKFRKIQGITRHQPQPQALVLP